MSYKNILQLSSASGLLLLLIISCGSLGDITPPPPSASTSTPPITSSPSPSATSQPTFTPTITPTTIGGAIPWLAFIGEDSQGDLALYIGSLYDGTLKVVAPVSGPVDRSGSIAISWSPDGDRIAFNSGNLTEDSIRILDIADDLLRELRRIPKGSWVDIIEWSPDGSWIAYHGGSIAGSSVVEFTWVVNILDGSAYKISDIPVGWASDSSGFYHTNRLKVMKFSIDTKTDENIKTPKQFDYFFPQADAYLNFAYGECPSVILSEDNSERQVCDLPEIMQLQSSWIASPNGVWLYGHGEPEEGQTLSYLLNLESFKVLDLSERLVWVIGWMPDNQSVVAITYKDSEKYLNPPQTIASWDEYIEYFDTSMSDIFQIEVISFSSGDSLFIYPFPVLIHPMLKAVNWYKNHGLGVGIGWPQP